MARPIRVLYADEERAAETAEFIERADDGVAVEAATGTDEGLERLDATAFDCVVSGPEISGPDAVGFLEAVRESHGDLPVVVSVGEGSETTASEAIAAGATDYFRTDAGPDRYDLLANRIQTSVRGRGGRDPTRNERGEVFDRMTDGVFALDDEWRFSYLNDRAAELVGDAIGEDPSAADLLGRNIWETIPEATETAFYERYHEAVDSQTPVSFESYYDPLDTWFDIRVYPSENGISVYFLDVTEKHRRESEIRNRERILREVYDVVSDTDRAFDEQASALLDIGRRVVGTEYASLSRVRDEEYVFEVVRAPDGTIEAGDVVDLSATHCERAIETNESLVLADIAADAPELTDRAGYTEWGVSCYVGAPVHVGGRVYGTFCFYDETPRKTPFSEWQVTLVDLMARWISYGLERRRVERRLRRQNDRLDEFASVLSHDLRNPLSVARGRLELLKDDVDAERLRPIRNAHERIEALISDVLTMAREGAAVETTDPVSLEELAAASWEHVDTGTAGLAVSGPIRIEADRDRLGRLLENLFRNSAEHGSGDGPSDDGATGPAGEAPDATGDTATESGVTVRIGRLRDGFYVEDDGPGIPEAERNRVFEYGYSTESDGTGLGLSIVRQIAEAHGWDVELAESNGGGARFEFTGVDAE
ncbi:hybrid sensor histidine kinase/response regulator [Natronomonas sp.]|uniref:hybrid sensor histidine kinase/response regulator n=1 Tax=Natronomonas sp. TaxID=2184060 RepID=UPI0026057B8D|nr:ATP-binding protein [Natronomonas sp.]